MPYKLNAITGDFDLVEDVSGFGDVSGPASSTDNAIARFDGTTGKLLQNSVVTIDDAGETAGMTQLDVDNIQINGNTIASTDTNGEIILSPDGTGGAVVTTNLTIGQSTQNVSFTVNGVAIDATVSVEEENATDLGGIVCHRHGSAASYGGHFVAMRSRGTHASETIVQSGDTLSLMATAGYDGTDYALAANITVQVDGTPSSNDMPGRIIFSTSQDGGQTPTEAMRIDSSQVVTLANALPEGSGGTNQTTYATGDVLYASGANTLSKLAAGTNGHVLTLAAGVPSWASAAGGLAAATQAEMEAASDNTVAATPANTQYHPGTCKAWVYFDGSGTVAINADYNVDSITDNGTGDYSIVIGTDFSTANYCAIAMCGRGSINGDTTTAAYFSSPNAVGSFRILTSIASVYSVLDSPDIYCAMFGDQ